MYDDLDLFLQKRSMAPIAPPAVIKPIQPVEKHLPKPSAGPAAMKPTIPSVPSSSAGRTTLAAAPSVKDYVSRIKGELSSMGHNTERNPFEKEQVTWGHPTSVEGGDAETRMAPFSGGPMTDIKMAMFRAAGFEKEAVWGMLARGAGRAASAASKALGKGSTMMRGAMKGTAKAAPSAAAVPKAGPLKRMAGGKTPFKTKIDASDPLENALTGGEAVHTSTTDLSNTGRRRGFLGMSRQ